MIVCGWCGQPSEPDRCGNCHRDPALPWVQRGVEAPMVDPLGGAKRRMAEVTADLESSGYRATAERIAERLDVSPRTVRRWQQKSAP
jgi:hypothetical protein